MEKMLLKILEKKEHRYQDQVKKIEPKIFDNSCSSIQRQDYLILKSKVEVLEDLLDIVSGLNEFSDETEEKRRNSEFLEVKK